jgi:hypothetical protein
MRLLLPCPLHEPYPLTGRKGIPYRAFHPPTVTESSRRDARRSLDPRPDAYVLFHAVAAWSSKMACQLGAALYGRQPAILEDYFERLPGPVTLVSVNDGSFLPHAPRGRLRVVNMPPLVVLYAAWGKSEVAAKWRAERAKYPFVAPMPRAKK